MDPLTLDLGIPDIQDIDPQPLGYGHSSIVYSGFDTALDRPVAVKMFDHDPSISLKRARARFDRESKVAAQLGEHPNIVTVFRSSFREPPNKPYIVMERLEGSLQDTVEKGPLGWEEAYPLISPVLKALSYAHGLDSPIIHNDVKPANILLDTDGNSLLADFGFSRVAGEAVSQTAGYTPQWSPPELWLNGEDRRDTRSDIYSVAATLYTLLSGAPPFSSGKPTNTSALQKLIETEEVGRLPSQIANEQQLAAIKRAMAKNPKNRYRSIKDLTSALEGGGEANHSTRTRTILEAIKKSSPKKPVATFFGVLTVVSCLFAVFNIPRISIPLLGAPSTEDAKGEPVEGESDDDVEPPPTTENGGSANDGSTPSTSVNDSPPDGPNAERSGLDNDSEDPQETSNEQPISNDTIATQTTTLSAKEEGPGSETSPTTTETVTEEPPIAPAPKSCVVELTIEGDELVGRIVNISVSERRNILWESDPFRSGYDLDRDVNRSNIAWVSEINQRKTLPMSAAVDLFDGSRLTCSAEKEIDGTSG